MHRRTASRQGAVDFVSPTTALTSSSGQSNSFNTMPHPLRPLGSATLAMKYHTAWGPWAIELLQLQCSATLPRGSGKCHSCYALPHPLGLWALECVQCMGPLAGGTGSPTREAVAS